MDGRQLGDPRGNRTQVPRSTARNSWCKFSFCMSHSVVEPCHSRRWWRALAYPITILASSIRSLMKSLHGQNGRHGLCGLNLTHKQSTMFTFKTPSMLYNPYLGTLLMQNISCTSRRRSLSIQRRKSEYIMKCGLDSGGIPFKSVFLYFLGMRSDECCSQKYIPEGACVAPVKVISMDKTQLTQFSGGKLAYPIYLTLSNIPRAMRCKPSQSACILIAYLSVNKDVGEGLTHKQKSACIQQLFHNSMQLVLDPLVQAGKRISNLTNFLKCLKCLIVSEVSDVRHFR